MENNRPNILAIALLSIGLIIFIAAAIFLITLNKKKEVTINTSPKNAHYKVGSLEGTAPAKISLKPGKYQIEISGQGYVTLNDSFEIKTFSKVSTLFYSLKVAPMEPSKKALEQHFGAGNPDPNWKSKLDTVKNKYSFYYKLPYTDPYFYISIPTYDDKFFVYVPKGNVEEGKRRALDWFDTNGVRDPAKNLNIIWQYR